MKDPIEVESGEKANWPRGHVQAFSPHVLWIDYVTAEIICRLHSVSQGTHLVTSYFVQYTCMSFTMKAMAAATALRLHSSSLMVMLYEIMLRLCHGYTMVILSLLLQLLRQPGERLYYGCRGSQERINVSAVPTAPRLQLLQFLSAS